MMFFKTTMTAAAVAMMVVGSSAAMAKHKTGEAQKPRTAESVQCSADANAKGLHGKDRKKFMSHCKKDHKPDTAKKNDDKKPEDKKS
jgi:hypothetical protein